MLRKRMKQLTILLFALMLPITIHAQEAKMDKSRGAEYTDGYAAMELVVKKNLKLSPEPIAITDKKVLIRFQITPSGQASDMEVVKSLTKWCDAEAIRVAKMLKQWKPAMNRDGNAEMVYHLILFEFDEEDDISVLTPGEKYAQQISEQDDWEFENSIPQFVGGANALINFVAKSIQYPQDAGDDSVKGTVFIKFSVDKTGNVYDANITKGASNWCNNEALRIVKIMPKWIPAQNRNGEVIEKEYNMPIVFRGRLGTSK